MKKNFSKAALLLTLALSVSAATFAQDSKTKIEGKGYELKVKQEGNEFKYKEKGNMPVTDNHNVQLHETVTVKQGQEMMTVKEAPMPASKPVAKKSYASRKVCHCKTVAARKPVAKKSTVAYKPKPKTNTVAATTPMLRDTVFVTRVDTVFSIIEKESFAGYRQDNQLRDDFKKLKIERENDGEIKMKKEYRDGREIKKTFASEDEFNTYMEWKNY